MTEQTRLALVTTHVFGIRAYEGIFASDAYLEGRIEVPLMIGIPPERGASAVGYASVADLAREQGTECVLTEDGSLTSLADRLTDCRPHYLLVVGWSRLIHPDVLALPATVHGAAGEPAGRYGCIGMHPTKLPTGRGQAPIPWTIIKGLRSTALSVFFLEPEADTGPIIAQYDLPVRPRESAASLFYRMASTHFDAGTELAGHLARRAVPARAQLSEQATRWPKRRPADGRISHDMTFAEIEALVRGLLGPYPRAFVPIGGVDHPVDDARRAETPAATDPATLEEVTADTVRFGCRDGVAVLRRHR
ncbi:methionyl-tRNA formyltransferase [Micromonospora mangrovi]|uniref:Formyltransferase family protein n=2 Tax=Micromonospora TaxID=1873 RepID=A0AAU8HJX3_9ACTN